LSNDTEQKKLIREKMDRVERKNERQMKREQNNKQSNKFKTSES
jgi:hypothetical protein